MNADAFWRATGHLLVVIGLTTLVCSAFVCSRANYDKASRTKFLGLCRSSTMSRLRTLVKRSDGSNRPLSACPDRRPGRR